jgi:glycine betaine/proline transport system permease protein
LAALPWTAGAAGAFILGYQLNGIRLGLLGGIGALYIAVFGNWVPSIQTLSFVLITTPICFVLGLSFGIWGYLDKKVETALQPVLNIMQTMPQFAYLVPIIALFGLGDHAGSIATIIIATPPMIRNTILGLKRISPEVVEAGLMSGCTKFQLLFKVLIPTARRDILNGVNTVIMQCLAMVVIASFVGAKGLGLNLKVALNSLKIGKAAEAGLCIVIIAVILDRYTKAWANKPIDYFKNLSLFERYRPLILFGVALIIFSIIAFIANGYFDKINYLYLIPLEKGLTIAHYIDAGVDWVWDTFFYTLNTFNKFLITQVLIPMKKAYLGMPVVATFTLAMGVGYIVGGLRTGLIVGGMLLFIALSEYWDRALITMYMATFAVLMASLNGIIVGSIFSQTERGSQFILSVCDFFETFPSFVYLIPVIFLFNITDTSVLIAAIIYGTVPATRYTVWGLKSVPLSLHEAGTMSGVSRMQRWTNIEIPIAFPTIMLGVNQTVVFSLQMVILGALIGTEDLGQIIFGALSRTKDGAGVALTLGVFVSLIAISVDVIVRKWAEDRKKALGLA